jgi:hypothetical protein
MWTRKTLFTEKFGELRWEHLTEVYKAQTENQQEEANQ